MFTIGERVKVVSLTDEQADSSFLGKTGVVEHLDYTGDCGQCLSRPLIRVNFGKDITVIEHFWPEELKRE